ncbi:auxin efflux carrier [Cognatishimia activa]|uniref:Auxin efflux carrier n=1 Tax=Cognatishimia activa TaxID=1715691 RepID=A0A0P1J0X3_9RHOB|nr:AEC family transporter [Cognatishimia activa]CUK26724.1 auxin efflux carrier [Cognatishimia activa]
MLDILNIVLPVFVLIGLGYVARWVGLVTDTVVDSMMRFTILFLVTALLFGAIADLDLKANFDGAMLGSYYAAGFACFCAGLLGARHLFGRPWEDSVVIGFGSLFANSLMLGLPIAERAFGAESLGGNFAIISVHSLFAYGVGITAMEIVKARGKSFFATVTTVLNGMVSNALVLAIAAGFAVNLSGITLPTAIDDSIDLLSQAALPTALFAIGGVLRRYRPEGDLRVVLYICALSLGLHPALAYALGSQFDISQDNVRSMITTASMAPGVNAYLFANLYGHAKRVAASAVLIGTALSIVTVSCWLLILQ